VAVSFGGGQALVPQMDGEGEGGAEGFGKCLGFGGLRAEVAGHVQRIADDDGHAVEFAEEAAEGFEVLFQIPADEGEDRLRGEAELIGDGYTDAAVAKIEAKVAGFHWCDGNAAKGRPAKKRSPECRSAEIRPAPFGPARAGSGVRQINGNS
jgi:hypothetical protein